MSDYTFENKDPGVVARYTHPTFGKVITVSEDHWPTLIAEVRAAERERIKNAYSKSWQWNGVVNDEQHEFDSEIFEAMLDGSSWNCAVECHTVCGEDAPEDCECKCHNAE